MQCKQTLILTIACFFCLQIEAQDFIYKKNGEIVTGHIIESFAKSISYKTQHQSDSTIHYITTNAIDSIKYQDGNIKKFHDILPDQTVSYDHNKLNNHHLIGIDLAGLLIYQNYTFSYEFLPGKAILGFKVGYMQKNNVTVEDYYYGNRFDLANSANWKLSLGTNIYFFEPRTFRIGTGLHYVFGEYSSHWFYDENIQQMVWNSSIRESHDFKGLSLTLLGFYNITKYFAVNLGADVPVDVEPNAVVSFHMEALLNF